MSDVGDESHERDGGRRATAADAGDSSGHLRHLRDLRHFVWPVRVYYEDTDAGGIVYYANYLRFMERARTEWLRGYGVEQARLKEEQGLIFVVVDVQAHYRKPARYDDLLQVTCEVTEIARASLTFKQEIFRDRVGGELLLDSEVRVACLDALKYRPRALPESVRELRGRSLAE